MMTRQVETRGLGAAPTVQDRSSRLLLAVAVLLLASGVLPGVGAQEPAGRDFRWAKSLPAGQWLRVHNINGNVEVTATDGDRVEVVGVRRSSDGWGSDDLRVEVHEGRDGVTICALWGEESWCDDRGSHIESRRDGPRRRGRIDLQVRLPRRLKLSANSVSGDVRVSGAGDEVRARSVSGDVRLERLRSPSVIATAVSGDVDVQIDALTGDGDLRFTSVSGNLSLQLPRSLDADVKMRTVSGQLESDFQLTLEGRMSRRNLSGRIGRGGRELQLSTVSGDVKLRAR